LPTLPKIKIFFLSKTQLYVIFIAIILSVLNACPFFPAAAGTGVSFTGGNRFVKNGIDALYRLDLDYSNSQFDSLISEFPDHPEGYLLKSSYYSVLIFLGFRKLTETEKEFVKFCKKTIQVSEKQMGKTITEAEGLFFIGGAYGFLARYYLAKGDWVNAVYNGKQSRDFLQESVEKDSQMYDAYMGLGLYHYYAAVLPKIVDALATFFGLGGNRELGIKQVKAAASRGKLLKREAELFLGDFYLDDGNYEAALDIYLDYSKRYPKNPFFIIQIGFLYYKMQEIENAYFYLLKALNNSKSQSCYAELMASYYLGKVCEVRNEFEQSKNFFLKSVNLAQEYELLDNYNNWVIPSGYYNLGEIYEYQGDREKAIQCYKIVKYHEDSDKSTVRSAKNRLSDPISSIEMDTRMAVNTVLQGNPDAGYKLLNSLKNVLENGEMDGEKKRLAYICYHMGKAMKKGGKFKEATDILKTAIQYFENFSDKKSDKWLRPFLLLRLGEAYLSLGQAEKAKKVLDNAMQYDDFYEEKRLKFLAQKYLSKIK